MFIHARAACPNTHGAAGAHSNDRTDAHTHRSAHSHTSYAHS